MLLARVINSDCLKKVLEVSQSYLLYLAQAVLLATWLDQIDNRNRFFTTDT